MVFLLKVYVVGHLPTLLVAFIADRLILTSSSPFWGSVVPGMRRGALEMLFSQARPLCCLPPLVTPGWLDRFKFKFFSFLVEYR